MNTATRKSSIGKLMLCVVLTLSVIFVVPIGASKISEGSDGGTVGTVVKVAKALDSSVYAASKSKTVKVKFNANGGRIGTKSSKTVKVKKGKKIGKKMPKNPKRSGYKFKGWYRNGKKITKNTKPKYSVTCYAYWQANPSTNPPATQPTAPTDLTVTFDANGGEVKDNQKTVKYKGTYDSLPVPTRFDYEFLGWFTEREGGTQVGGSTVVTATTNHTLYAHWKISATTYLADLTQYEWTGGESAWQTVVSPGEAVSDNHGTVHSYGMIGNYRFGVVKFISPNTVTYDLNTQYKAFEAIWGLRENKVDENKNLWLKVYGDDRLLFVTPSITNGSSVKPFSIDVSGVKYLKFELCSDYPPSGEVGRNDRVYGIFDPILYR